MNLYHSKKMFFSWIKTEFIYTFLNTPFEIQKKKQQHFFFFI